MRGQNNNIGGWNYKILLLCGAIIAVSVFTVTAQQRDWSVNKEPVANIDLSKAAARRSFPTEFKLFNLNIEPLRRELFSIVESQSDLSSTIVSLPNADGKIEQFELFEASNFEPELQAKFPDIRAFSGRGITDRFATVKLSISPKGVSGTVFRTATGFLDTGGETEIIEPYSADHTIYAVFRSKRNVGELPWSCTTPEERELFSNWKSQIDKSQVLLSNTGEIRTLRLAQSNNGEYSNYFGADDPSEVAQVLAGYNATLTRTNGIYERDLGLHLNLIPQSTSIIFYNPVTDPYSNDLGNWNAELAGAIAAAGITPAMYDIGHMFGASGGGGNAGCIGCICSPNHNKGMGITSPASGGPEGDNFDIDYVAHEVGHQLGANHTFSYGQLPVPEMLGQDKEIGSGITIMGYAGITEVDTAPHSIDIFHETSIGQVQANLPTRGCPAAGIITMTANNRPVISPVVNRTIPIMTPFALTGSATDPEGDALTYNWEQNDSANNTGITVAASSASAAKTIGPNWISFPSTSSPTKLFPRLSTILAGQFTTDAHPGGDTATIDIEALSAVQRTLNFRLTVRDNHPYVPGSTIGQTQFTDMAVTVTALSGPFMVSVPNTNVTYAGNSTQTVTWLVSNTTLAPVSTANVKISLSRNGGFTFPIVLAASTPNDGSQAVTMPNISTTTARVKIEAIGNIFLDISDTNFIITSLNPTAARSSISGKITDANGRGVRNAVISLRANDGTVRTVSTNPFGFYTFSNVVTGSTYVIIPRHKLYTFSPESIAYSHLDEVSNLNFSVSRN